jgi:alcohol dehydrogenase class IV
VKNVFVGKNVLSDTFGLLALQNIFKALRTAVKDGKNIEPASR